MKDTFGQRKRYPQTGRKHLQKNPRKTDDGPWIGTIQRALKTLLNNKGGKTQFRLMIKDLNRHLTKYAQMAGKHMKRHSSGNCKNETRKYQGTSFRIAKIQKINSAKCWCGCRATRTLSHCRWDCKIIQLLWKVAGNYLKKLTVILS